MAEAKKTSFFDTTLNGIIGSVKGSLTGAGVGAILGASAGAVISIATGGIGLAAIGTAALLGAQLTAIPMAAIGALSGTVTGVVTSREAAQPSAADMMNIAKMSYTQGLSAGKQMALEESQGQGPESTKWRDRHAEEQAAKAVSNNHTIH